MTNPYTSTGHFVLHVLIVPEIATLEPRPFLHVLAVEVAGRGVAAAETMLTCPADIAQQ